MPNAILTKRNLLYAGLILSTLPVAACNTVQGAGKDVQKVGEVVEDGAQEAGEEIGEEAGEID